MPIYWLSEEDYKFPHPELANEDGIVAIGGDLSPQRLLIAYQIGLFPWFNPDDPILWWSPDPRFVLFPDKLKVAKSMRTYFNQNKYKVTCDREFEKVMRSCQINERKGQSGGTWISEEMIEAYSQLHELGFAHSVEVWDGEALVAGLYGIGLGKIFYGESMFTNVSNGSKFGFISLVRELEKQGYWLIDCQQETNHLKSMGAEPMVRKEFLEYMDRNAKEQTKPEKWLNLFDKD